MLAEVYSRKQLIGTVELKAGDTSMGHVYGDLIPNPFYFKLVQNHVYYFWQNPKPNQAVWAKLLLNVKLNNGLFLFPVGGLTISDFQDYPDEPIRIDIAGLDSDVINDFITTDIPKVFVEDPWETISISSKLDLENELRKELGIIGKQKSLLFRLFRKDNYKHILSDCAFSAVCKNGQNDDVLFSIHNRNLKEKYALVHLTYRGSQEQDGWPYTHLFKNFGDFKYNRMYRDKTDCQD